MKYNEISHFSHTQHKLKFEYTEVPFKCDGCKEIGIGSCYKCKLCDYDLHMHCAIPTPSIYHPFYSKCCFVFMSRPPGNVPRYCNACERAVSGFLYHCNSCGFDLHPCCAKLPTMLDHGDIKLYLYRKVSATCERCGIKGRSWSYRSSNKKYNLHVACVKDMLIESWQHLYNGRVPSSTTTIATRGGRTTIQDVPGLKAAVLQTHNHKYTNNNGKNKGSKVQKCCEMAGMTLQFVISAVLGDPTSLIAGVIGSLMSR
ncbi:putative nucleoredoxin 1 [Bienertia sinuspersici]